MFLVIADTFITTIHINYVKGFRVLRALHCDVFLGSHGRFYGLNEKYPKLQKGAPNPFIDKAGCLDEADIQEAMFHAIQAEQQKTGK